MRRKWSHYVYFCLVIACIALPFFAFQHWNEGRASAGPIRNPKFAEGAAPWWGNAKVSIVSKDGASAAELTGGFVVQEKIPVQGRKRYRLTVKILSEDAPEQSAFVQLSMRGEATDNGWFGPLMIKTEGRQEPAAIISGGSHPWRDFSVVFETTAGATQLLVYLRKVPNTSGKAYFTDVRLEATEENITRPEQVERDKLVAEKLAPALTQQSNEGKLRTQISASQTTATSLPVIENGRANAAIYVGNDESLITIASAAEMASYLGQMTGQAVEKISNDKSVSDRPLIIIGADNAVARTLALDKAIKDLSADGFIIRTVGRNVIIAGATPRGTMYGVNWFLDHSLGIKWLSPGVTYVPHPSAITLPVLNERQEPRFAYRELLIAEAQDKRWRQHNLLNGESHGPSYEPTPAAINSWNKSWFWRTNSATFFELLPQAQYEKTHPDWYAGGQLAMMNKAMRSAIAAAIVKRLRQIPDYQNVWYAVSDQDWGWDLDKDSKAFADSHGRTAAAPRLDMMIDVAQQVRSALPGAKLAFNAYHWSFTPPTGITVPDFLLVYPMTIQVDYSQPLNGPKNQSIADGIKQWSAISQNVLVWDHIANFGGFIQPTPNILPIAQSIQWLATLPHVGGYFAEGSWDTRGSEFAALRGWVFSRLLWNPNQDVHKLIAEFCDLYYGPAGPVISQYIAMSHEKILQTGDRLTEKTQVDMKMYDEDFIVRASHLFDQAQRLSKGTIFEPRVREARIPVDYVALVRRSEYKAAAAQLGMSTPEELSGKIEGLMTAIKAAGITQFFQGGSIAALKTRLSITRTTPKLSIAPKAMGHWRDVQDLSFNLYGGAQTVADPAASDGAAVAMPVGDTSWNVQLKLDKLPSSGTWWAYASVRIASPDETSDALHVGSAPPMACFSKVNASPSISSYRWVEFPAGPHAYSDDHNLSLYFAAVPTKSARRIFVDRIILTERRLGREANIDVLSSPTSCH